MNAEGGPLGGIERNSVATWRDPDPHRRRGSAPTKELGFAHDRLHDLDTDAAGHGALGFGRRAPCHVCHSVRIAFRERVSRNLMQLPA